jgi:hypothetical protein
LVALVPAGRIWSPAEQVLFVLSAVGVSIPAYLYCFHMERQIAFDEIGLHNPIYTYYVTGHMTYPMHGQLDSMTVHPPTHYLIIALLMKMGLPLFKASAIPLFGCTILSAFILFTGRFSFLSAIALLLALFLGTFIWGDFYSLRPDLMVTFCWFAGLLALQAARNNDWSEWRLFLGAAFSVLAACVHYWGIAALLGIPCFAAALIYERRSVPRSLLRPMGAIAAGALVIGLPFIVLFVVPQWTDILAMVHAVQNPAGESAGPVRAFERHVHSYSLLAQRLEFPPWVRGFTSVLTWPVLNWRIPAVFIGVPCLALWREVRMIAVAGAPLPLFVLFYSQGKQVGYTGYLMPEMILYFAGVLLLLLRASALPFSTTTRPIVQTCAAVSLVALSVCQVPSSMGSRYRWTSSLDLLDVLRGAAVSMVGSNAVVGSISAGTWYTSGATFLWNAFTDLVTANREHVDIAEYTKPVEAMIIDLNWWNALPQYAPLGAWYTGHVLNLRGFALPTAPTALNNFQLFLTVDGGQVTGYFIGTQEVTKFVENTAGEATFAVLSCPATIELSKIRGAFYKNAFAYQSKPGLAAPQLVLLGFERVPVGTLEAIAADSGCLVRDALRGSLLRAPRQELVDIGREAYSAPITFYERRDDALRAAGRSLLGKPQ